MKKLYLSSRLLGYACLLGRSEYTISSTCCLLATLSLHEEHNHLKVDVKIFFHLYYKYSLYKCLIGAEYYLEPLNAIYERMF